MMLSESPTPQCCRGQRCALRAAADCESVSLASNGERKSMMTCPDCGEGMRGSTARGVDAHCPNCRADWTSGGCGEVKAFNGVLVQIAMDDIRSHWVGIDCITHINAQALEVLLNE